MRLLFICSSLEPGRDGVGDYTRRLGQAMAGLEHAVAMIALNEAGLSAPTQESQAGLACLRLPAGLSWEERVGQAKQWVGEHRPDVVSLQFVSYGYHPKGLPWGLGARLAAITGGRRVHVMFHETWIGFGGGSSVSHRLVGRWQRRIIVNLVTRLKPAWVQTSNETYRQMLEGVGVRATVLPLFSNIAVYTGDPVWMRGRLAELGIGPGDRERWVLLGVFGSVHPGRSLLDLIREKRVEATRAGKRVAFLGIGRLGAAADATFGEIRSVFADEVVTAQLGEQPAEHVSQFLQALDYGIATTPRELVDKSGTVAAMRHHGVRVLVPFGGRSDESQSKPAELPGHGSQHETDVTEVAQRLSAEWQAAREANQGDVVR